MECRDCKCSLTPDEAARHLAWENEKDAFERTLYAAIETPLEDEAADLPDAVPTGVSALPAMPGDLTIPASWSLPVCDRCTFALNLDDFFGGWDLDVSSAISWAYEVGWPPCHQSDVMALSWALVRRHWRAVLGEDDEEPTELEQENQRELAQLCATLRPRLTEDEYAAACTMAEEAIALADEASAPRVAAIMQKLRERSSH